MSNNQHHQHQHFYGFNRSVQPNASIGSHHARGRRSNVVALPNLHPSPLFINEPLPPVPFLRGSGELHSYLRWGNWRVLPTRRSNRPRTVSQETLRSPATTPPQGELMMLVNINGVQYEALIRPGSHSATTVTVSDVVEAVEYEGRRAAGQRPAGGSYPYNGHAIHRGHDGIWQWYGLDSSPGEDDVWVLYLGEESSHRR